MVSLRLVALLGVIVGNAAGYEFAEPLDAQEFTISSQIVDAIEGIKLQMGCGFPTLGIPPLDPFRVPQSQVNLTSNHTSLNGTVDNLSLHGIPDFDIVDLHLSLLRNKINFHFFWKNIQLKTRYNLLFKSNETKFDIGLQRNGLANIALKGLKVWGQGKYKISLIGNRVKLQEFKVFVSLEKVVSKIEGLASNRFINRAINSFIEEWIMVAINDNTLYIGELSNKYVVPMVNDAIGDKTLRELLAAIGGGKGGPSSPTEPCKERPEEPKDLEDF